MLALLVVSFQKMQKLKGVDKIDYNCGYKWVFSVERCSAQNVEYLCDQTVIFC